jgi:hypothetical protein
MLTVALRVPCCVGWPEPYGSRGNYWGVKRSTFAWPGPTNLLQLLLPLCLGINELGRSRGVTRANHQLCIQPVSATAEESQYSGYLGPRQGSD